jgi:hypothetical protein
VTARLLINSTFHLARGLATFCLASGAIFTWTKMFRADNLAHWFSTFHLATICVEAFATSRTYRLIAFWTTLLIALRRVACPRAHGRAIFRLALLLHAVAPFFPTAIAMKVATMAFCGSFASWWFWQGCFNIILDHARCLTDRFFN